jgi:hypothetical protein
MSNAATCRHYATVGPPHTIEPPIEGMNDPEHLLVDLVECVPDAQYVTLVIDVDTNRALRLVDVLPHISHEHGMRIVRQLKANGVFLWFDQEHAALTDKGWIDVEALEGEPMTRAHQ